MAVFSVFVPCSDRVKGGGHVVCYSSDDVCVYFCWFLADLDLHCPSSGGLPLLDLGASRPSRNQLELIILFVRQRFQMMYNQRSSIVAYCPSGEGDANKGSHNTNAACEWNFGSEDQRTSKGCKATQRSRNRSGSGGGRGLFAREDPGSSHAR